MKTGKRKSLDYLYNILLSAVLLFIVIILMNGYRIIHGKGSSMEPTLKDGETTVERTRFYTIERFSIVDLDLTDVQAISTDGIKDLGKRVIGLPRETVEIKDYVVYINGQAVNEPFETIENSGETSDKDYKFITLGDDAYFVMGDNRDASADSRTFGPIKREQIKGIEITYSQANVFEKGLCLIGRIIYKNE
jgi:signal peptidase I